MMHPNTKIQFINGNIGVGLFATAFIPKGTITYVKDQLEIRILPDDPIINHPLYAVLVEKYSFIDGDGTRIISWDHAKYVNHCCECNTISTGYGFEIAIRDIQKEEQITDEYGLFNIKEDMALECGNPRCRKVLNVNDIDLYGAAWDEKAKAALFYLEKVDQPLSVYLDKKITKAMKTYLKTGKSYKSVMSLRCRSSVKTSAPV